jgi:hypothetical protein
MALPLNQRVFAVLRASRFARPSQSGLTAAHRQLPRELTMNALFGRHPICAGDERDLLQSVESPPPAKHALAIGSSPVAEYAVGAPDLAPILSALRWHFLDQRPEFVPSTALREAISDALAHPELGFADVDEQWCCGNVLVDYTKMLHRVSLAQQEGAWQQTVHDTSSLTVYLCVDDSRPSLAERQVVVVPGIAVWPLAFALRFRSVEVALGDEGRLMLTEQHLQRLARTALSRDPDSLRALKAFLPPAMLGSTLQALF